MTKINQLAYGFEKELSGVDFEEALERVTEALQGKGFGVLTEIDVKATMKKKLDKEYPKYKILGACNPVLADRALTADKYIGLMLPCNVVVREVAGRVLVSVMNPQIMASMSDDPELQKIASEAEKLVKEMLVEL
ncbi:DUF302 domain-containing protein [bacterium]|nr:DUF302 domain-containing protein [bacterium]MBU1637298.1 DUF302 domain-containing protein [bacterium]